MPGFLPFEISHEKNKDKGGNGNKRNIAGISKSVMSRHDHSITRVIPNAHTKHLLGLVAKLSLKYLG